MAIISSTLSIYKGLAMQLSISNKNLSYQALEDILRAYQINCRYTPNVSLAYNKVNNLVEREMGALIDIFDDISTDKLFLVYTTMVHQLNINCVWVDTDTHHGCITKMVEYPKWCEVNEEPVMSCSMYE